MKRFMHWMIAASLACAAGMGLAADVLLGPGDVVKASVYGSPDLATETRVSESGAMTFPLLGEVQVGGLSTQQAEKKIGGLLEKGGYLRKAQVNLLVTTLASQQVSVLGQVNRPGRYPVEGKRKVLDLLALAGGIGPEGGDMVSLVRNRDGAVTRETIDVVDMVRKGELNRDYEVAGGDVIFVERAPRAYITGEVQRPGPFRIERAMTVQQALSAGGGLTMRGTERGLRVTRRDAAGVARTIEVKRDDLVQIDDVITVRESWF
ncbi:polysaccharide export protein EpsE [Massilia forsythiae]|uniref:Polysaccharide export protein EpsE n=1 Tax=Massilia forsythiae TaxID=2728020 RepID=A0A7Z2VTB5_9BURK|nr:polysaccharide export protein EpsE [Massilia forsythiae]QJD98788.1 polysaccharide export protein EpsE [Massilia forsythiae]